MNECSGDVKVRLHGALQHEVGSKEVALPGDVGTVKEALCCLADRYGERASDMIFNRSGDVWRSLILLVNDEPARLGPDTGLSGGDIVTVLLPLAGG